MSSASRLNSETTLDLPSYSPSDPAPRYSFEPACDEQRLQLTPRSSTSHRTPTGTWIKKSGKTTVILSQQEEGTEIPSYGRTGPVAGTLLLEDSESVIEVEVKVEGKLDIMASETGGETIQLIHKRYTLWSKQPSGSSPDSQQCPTQLAFSFILPTTFRDGDSERPLPPSYDLFYSESSTILLKSAYVIRVAVTRTVHQKLVLWTKTKHVLVPFDYVPRTRAHRPILATPHFFSSIKTSPEEWYQAISTVKTREGSPLQPLTSHLFIPAGRVYGVRDTVPFHLQLSGRVSTLRELFSTSYHALGRAASADSHTTAASKRASLSNDNPIIRACLLRQVTLEVCGKKTWRNLNIGEGTLTSVPPLQSSCCYSTASDTREEHLDWEGEFRCHDNVPVGGFVVSNAQVKEFVILEISPPASLKSLLSEMRVSIPIRIVTDSWGDTPNTGSSDP